MADLSVEVRALVQFIGNTGVPHRVTATLGRYVSPSNPCDPHSPGSYHCKPGTGGQGLAIDLAGPSTGAHPSELLPIFAAFSVVESQLAELIYSGAPYSIRDGKRVPKYAVSQHWNHVHVAVKKGTVLVSQRPGGVLTMPTTTPDYATAGTPVALRSTKTGQGYWIVTSDGGVFTFGDAPFCGSLGGVALAAPVIGMEPTPSGLGYWLLGQDGGVFSFGDAAYLGRVHK